MKNFFLTLLCILIISSAWSQKVLNKNHRNDITKTAVKKPEVKKEIQELLLCKCIDMHIEELIKLQNPDIVLKHDSPLFFGKLVYNGLLSNTNNDFLIDLADSFNLKKVQPDILRFKKSREDYSGMDNIYNWCNKESKTFLNNAYHYKQY